MSFIDSKGHSAWRRRYIIISVLQFWRLKGFFFKYLIRLRKRETPIVRINAEVPLLKNDRVKRLWFTVGISRTCNTFELVTKGESIDRLFQFLSRTPIEGLLPQNSRRTLGRRRRYTPSYTYIYIYRYRVSWVARWITTAGPTDLATALKSGLIYYYVLLLLFGYLYPYNIMPREIPRSRRYVTAQLPRDRDLIFRIGHNLGRSCYVEYYLSPQLFHGPSTISHASYR